MSRARRSAYLCCLGAAFLICGCRTSPGVRLAREAERDGKPVRAYELYCEAAEDHRRSRRIAAALRRLVPEVAAHYEAQAKQALTRKEYAEAWRLYIRVLEVQPHHPTAVQSIRQLEANHAQAIAQVKRDWRERGSKWLALAAEGTVQRPTERPVPPPVGRRTEAPSLADADTVAQNRRKPMNPIKQRPPQGRRAATSRPASGSPHVGSKTKPSFSSPSTALRRAPATTRPSKTDGEGYLVARTLSRRDDRFPERSALLDGLVAELEETDGTPSADLTISLDGRRVAQFHRLGENHIRRLRGRSGFGYDLIVISIEHPRRTIRLGLRRASD